MRIPIYGLLTLCLFAAGCDTTETGGHSSDSLAQQQQLDRIRDLETTKRLASQGNLNARTNLAFLAWTQNDPDSIGELKLLAEVGSIQAARVLARSFQAGILVDVDYEEAASWLDVAADLGDSKSALELHYYRASA